MDTQVKYLTNKTDYLRLRTIQIGGGDKHSENDGYSSNEDYYVIHSTSIDNMVEILRTGELFANKYLPDDRKIHSGFNESEFIFATIVKERFWGDPIFFGPGIIFSKEVLKDNDYYFSAGWGRKETIVSQKDENDQSRKDKLDMVMKQISDPIYHEVKFKERLNLDDMIGIVLYKPTIDMIDKIRRVVGHKIPIYVDGVYPSINEQ